MVSVCMCTSSVPISSDSFGFFYTTCLRLSNMRYAVIHRPTMRTPQVPENIGMLADGRMDTKTAAIYVGLSVQTLAIKRSNGTGPKFVKRGRVFYYREDLDEWLRSMRVSSTAEEKVR